MIIDFLIFEKEGSAKNFAPKLPWVAKEKKES